MAVVRTSKSSGSLISSSGSTNNSLRSIVPHSFLPHLSSLHNIVVNPLKASILWHLSYIMHATDISLSKHIFVTFIFTLNNLTPFFSISIGSTLILAHKSHGPHESSRFTWIFP